MARMENMPFLGLPLHQTYATSRGWGRPAWSAVPTLCRLSSIVMAWAIPLALFMLLVPAASAQVPVNTCADPSNQGTLRCAMFSAAPPYLNPGRPSAPGDVKTFTRVFLLADNTVRCFDGTAPTLYVDPAVDAAGTTIVSNKWLFTFTGGGSCARLCENFLIGSISHSMITNTTIRWRIYGPYPRTRSPAESAFPGPS